MSYKSSLKQHNKFASMPHTRALDAQDSYFIDYFSAKLTNPFKKLDMGLVSISPPQSPAGSVFRLPDVYT